MTVVVKPVETYYLAGEPIALSVTMTNNSLDTVGVVVDFPSFDSDGPSGLHFSLRAGDPDAATSLERGKPPSTGNFRSPIREIPPGESLSVHVFLQRFFPVRAPGVHRVDYVLDLRCMSGTSPRPGIKAKGSFEILILASDDYDLDTHLAKWMEPLKGLDFDTRREAEEALSVTPSALVIPRLKVMFESDPNAALKALTKFRGNPEAQAVLMGLLRGTNRQMLAGISLLEAWDFRLDDADFGSLVTRGDTAVRLAVLRYAAQSKDPRYLPFVRGLRSADDGALAAEAARVEALLTR